MEILVNADSYGDVSWSDIEDLYKTSIGHCKSREQWLWENEKTTNFFTISKDGAVVGIERMMGIEFFDTNRKIITVGQSFDTVVRPDFRGQGIFTNMVQLAVKQLGYPYYYGICNGNSRDGFLKMGWNNCGKVNLVESIAKSDTGSELFYKYDPMRHVIRSPHYICGISKRFDHKYVDWRYQKKPGSDYDVFVNNVGDVIVLNVFNDDGVSVVQVVDKTCAINKDVDDLINCYCQKKKVGKWRVMGLCGNVIKSNWIISNPTHFRPVLNLGDWDVV